MPQQIAHQISVRKKVDFLRRIAFELIGDSLMSIEGHLSQYQFDGRDVVARQETGILKRSTVSPQFDFAVLRLEGDTIDRVFKGLVALGFNAIVHVQIERNGILELGAYDNFHPQCVATGPGISSSLLEELQSANVIWDFKLASPTSRQP